MRSSPAGYASSWWAQNRNGSVVSQGNPSGFDSYDGVTHVAQTSRKPTGRSRDVQRAGKLTGACIVFRAAEPTLPPPMRSILIVSRSTPETTALTQRLEQADYLVLTVEQVDDAVESLTALVPGAILIDLPLSQVRRLIRQLRARPQLRGIPRLLVCADPLGSRQPPGGRQLPPSGGRRSPDPGAAGAVPPGDHRRLHPGPPAGATGRAHPAGAGAPAGTTGASCRRSSRRRPQLAPWRPAPPLRAATGDRRLVERFRRKRRRRRRPRLICFSRVRSDWWEIPRARAA